MKSIKKVLVLILVLSLSLVVLCSCDGSSGGSAKTNTCGVCGRSWPAGDSGGNFMSIARTHMCVNCYNNYQYAQKTLGR